MTAKEYQSTLELIKELELSVAYQKRVLSKTNLSQTQQNEMIGPALRYLRSLKSEIRSYDRRSTPRYDTRS